MISQEKLQQQLVESLADALYLKSSEIDPTKSFMDLGLDSIIGVEWLNTINKFYKTDIAASVVYDYPTIQQLASFLYEKLSLNDEIVQEMNDTIIVHDTKPLHQTSITLPSINFNNNGRQSGTKPNSPLTKNRFFNRGGIRFEPKYGEKFKGLYFYSSDCSGNFEEEGEFSVHHIINLENNVCLSNHKVFGEYLLSTDAYVEMVYVACATYFKIEKIQLKDITIGTPLLGFHKLTNYLRIVFSKHQEGLSFSVKSSLSPNYENEKTHMQGIILNNNAYETKPSRLIANTAITSANDVESDQLKNLQKDVDVGDFYSSLQKLSFGNNFALGQLKVADGQLHFFLNPTILFGGLTTAMFFGVNQISKRYDVSNDVFIPSAIGNISINGVLNEATYYCYAEVIQLEKDKIELYLEIIDHLSNPVLIVESIRLQRVSNKAIRQMVSQTNSQTIGQAQSLYAANKKTNLNRSDKPVDVAIIGMSCRFPKSDNVDAFWENLKNGADCITEIPENRWKEFSNWYHPDPYHQGTAHNKWGGFIHDIDAFDPLFFGISPSEAEFMDPQQRIFLEECWKTIESAGYAPKSLSDQTCGVYVGCAAGDYAKVLAAKGKDTSGAAFLGTSNSILAARISYHLNLKGPSVAIDTACSSSLTAIHMACESIRNGENKLALAGGVALMLTPGGHILTSQVGMQSKTGKCATFDIAADGTVFSEGCGVVFLKALPEAIKDNDHILGVIKASGINQDGKTNGITAPSSLSQSRLLTQIYERYNINPKKIGYVEAHGTGTPMGDPIEFSSLVSVFEKFSSEKNYCAIGSVKSNVGHSSFAAGVSGLIKVLLCLRHKKLVPSIHFEHPNPQIKLDQSPFFVNTAYRDWQSEESRLACISSFGFSGTNAHLVVEEYRSDAEKLDNSVDLKPYLIPLSAKTPTQLEQRAKDLLSFILKSSSAIDLSALAYTLQVGRDAMEYRLGFVVDSTEELTKKLQSYNQGEKNISNTYRGQVKRNDLDVETLIQDDEVRETIIAKLIADKNLIKLLELWVRGLDITWDKLYQHKRPIRIDLPTYPFSRESYWIEGVVHEQSAGVKIHPLLHRNISNLNQQRYSTTFSGNEFFLTDHQVKEQKILPGVAYLEMVCAAVQDAAPSQVKSACIELHNTVWLQPVIGTPDKQVFVDLTVDDTSKITFDVYSADTEQTLTHCQGKVLLTAIPARDKIEIQQLLHGMEQSKLDVSTFYATYAAMGIHYGPAHKAITALYTGNQSLIAYLTLPASIASSQNDFLLHPSMMDCALQASLGLVADHGQMASTKPSLPFALEFLRVLAPCTKHMVAWVRYANNSKPQDPIIKLDVDLCDEHGNICVQMSGFSARQLESDHDQKKNTLQLFSPIWKELSIKSPKRIPPQPSTKILLIGNQKIHFDWVLKSYPGAAYLHLPTECTIEFIYNKLRSYSFDQLVWIAPDLTAASQILDNLANGDIIENQEDGVLATFRIAKALIQLEYANTALEWTIITGNTQMVNKRHAILPTHAGITGFIGSLAKEFPHWKLRLIDVDTLDVLTAMECLTLSPSKQGDGLVYRRGEWFCQELANVQLSSPSDPIYKQKGVYVVVGGAGGLGEVWSRFMIETYQAKIIWIGRRKLNDEIKKKIDLLSEIGDAPLYLSADATVLGSLQQAFEIIGKDNPIVNGVVHSAIVLQDQSVTHMDEAKFKSSLVAKVDISVNIDRVFGKLDLDFMLFFSSIISFSKSPGQSNYAAGCTFKDAFAQNLNLQRPYPVKIINWGYWGNTGVVAGDSYKTTMEQMGIGSIEPEEGMETVRSLVNSAIEQMVVLKTLTPQILNNFNLTESVICYAKNESEILTAAQEILKKKNYDHQLTILESEFSNPTLEKLQAEILASSLLASTILKHEHANKADLMTDKEIAPIYHRWLDRSINYLQENKWLNQDLILNTEVRPLVTLWAEWENNKKSWASHPNLHAQIELLEVCLKALPAILTGKKTATDVLFPASSTALVEGIYKDNPLADLYNEILSNTLETCIKHKLEKDKTSKIRILEIGAGTGGTTAKLLPLLQKFASSIEVYCYTDVSKAFLMYAEKHYAPQLDVLTTALFDVTKPLSTQSIAADTYDFVIASNVLHATPSIRQALRNAKATLKNGGILLLNEISEWSLFTHLTFGLLEGWWLNEDVALRIAGSPGIVPEKWQEILAEEGYHSIFFPAYKTHKLGQQIIAASSDGVVRQQINHPSNSIETKSIAVSEPENTRLITKNNTPVKTNSDVSIREMSVSFLQDIVSETLKIKASQLDPSRSLTEYGLDSILVNQLTTQLRKTFPDITSTLFFEVQSIDGLADYLIENKKETLTAILLSSTSIASPQKELPPLSAERMDLPGRKVLAGKQLLSGPITTKAPSSTEYAIFDVAIIGVSGRYPKSSNLKEFWNNLSRGINCIAEIPEDRWNWKDYYDPEKGKPGKMYTKWGGFLKDIDKFDPMFFKISPAEAENMDPQERLFLETCYHAIEDAGYTSVSLDNSRKIGVFAGVMNASYAPMPTYFSVANRVSYLFNFQGPSMTVDTACSSSSTAIHLALESLYSGSSACAIAGGVNLIIDPFHYLRLTGMNMLSTDSRCKAFGAHADGFIDAEGVGAIVLKPLRQAELDGDHIYAIVKGSAVNAGGKTNGYTVPSPIAQSTLIVEALNRARVEASQISYLEAHGTGTALGDPIEIAALTRAFKQSTDEKQFCAIGSSKSNIGHCESAAGIAALTKVLLQLKHKQLVPSLHADDINPEIDFNHTPFKLQTSLRKWQRPIRSLHGIAVESPLIAGISSFGAGGANVHIVVQEYLPSETANHLIEHEQNTNVAIILSAKTAQQLKQKALDLLNYIRAEEEQDAINLWSMAFTLQTGREAMEERLGFIVTSIEQLAEKLQTYINDESRIENTYYGSLKDKNERIDLFTERKEEDVQATIGKWFREKKYAKLLDLWVNGLDLDWNRLYEKGTPKRISLPLYPFAKESYWLRNADHNEPKNTILHPLLHSNTSNLYELSYRAIFYGEETFVNNDQLSGKKILSAAAYLEMARVAIENALPNHDKSLILELQNTLWGSPAVLTGSKQINITLVENNRNQLDYEIYSVEQEQETIHCSGTVMLNRRFELSKLNIQMLQRQMTRETLDQRKLQDISAKMGAGHEILKEVIEAIYVGDRQQLIHLSIPDRLMNEQAIYVLHPILIDCVFQLAAGILTERHQSTDAALYPQAIDAINIFSAYTEEMFAWVRKSQDVSVPKVDIDLCNKNGAILIQLRGISLQPLNISTPIQVESAPPTFIEKEKLISHNGIEEQERSAALFFQEDWIEEPLSLISSKADENLTLIFTDVDFYEKLVNNNDPNLLQKAVLVYQAEHYKKESDQVYYSRFSSTADMEQILNSLSSKQGKPISLVYAWAKDREEAGVHTLFNLFKAIKASLHPVNQVTIIGHYDPADLKACWDYAWIGFERSLKMLLPTIKVSLLYTDTSSYTPQQIIDASSRQGVIWYRKNKRFTLACKPFEVQENLSPSMIKQNGIYLITGGCGGLGFKFAHYLAEKYHATLVLVGRTPLSTDIQKKIDALIQAGAQDVHYNSIDICDQQALQTWAKNLPFELSGIIHAAGVGSIQPFYEKTTNDIKNVLYPKTVGTIMLDKVLAQHPLDFVCYFSSSSALLGDSGSCDYAVANRFLMAYASFRNQRKQHNGKTYVINWPLWQAGGMTVDDPEKLAFYLKSSGLDTLETATGIDIWDKLLQMDQIQSLIMIGKPSRINEIIQRIYEPETQAQKTTGTKALSTFVGKGWRSSYQDFSLNECVIADLKQHISSILKIGVNKLDIKTNLADYGFDSISIAALSKQLTDYFSLEINPSLFFTYTCLEQLGDYFVQECSDHIQAFYRAPQENFNRHNDRLLIEPLTTQQTPISSIRRSYIRKTKDSEEPVAIVGLSGRFPKADTVDQLWSLLEEGESGITEIPLSRWDWRDYFTHPDDITNKITTNKGGFINNIEEFDPLFFKMEPQEASIMDPAQRLLLMEAYHAIEDAGIDPTSLRGTKVGVFVGMEESQYGLLAGMQGLAHSGIAMISSRLSYYLDLHGPNIATNTACSSGLVALHQAAASIRQKECEAALVAGIWLTLSPMSYVAMSHAGMLSKNGQSHSLSTDANGMGIGEAIAVLMLKPLSAAILDGDHIYGTIKASGINFDGKTNGVTAPNGQMQAQLIERIYAENDVNVRDISHIVTHATGTKIGDSIEINALNKAFKTLLNKQSDTDKKIACAITSSKSNIGHTMAASGLVSVITLLKGMQHQKIPGSIFCEKENEYITWKDSSFYINKTTQEWKRDGLKPYMGGVSAFGRSGTNAHIVIEEHRSSRERKQVRETDKPSTVIIPLSAKSKEQLKQKANDLLNFLTTRKQHERDPSTTDLSAMAYTLQTGREAMDERIGFLVNSIEQLTEKLQAYSNDHDGIEDFYQGNVKHNQEGLSVIDKDEELKKSIVDNLIANNKFSKLLDLWVKGLKFTWDKLYDANRPKRISLPGYPFAKEKYWVDTPQKVVNGIFKNSSNNFFSDNATKAFAKDDNFQFNTVNGNTTAIHVSITEKTELFLKRLIAQQLQTNVDKIDSQDSFFDLGVNSLGITNLIGKLNHLLQENLMPSLVFEYSTPYKLATFLEKSFSEKIRAIVNNQKRVDNESIWTHAMQMTPEKNNTLVPIQTMGEKEPIFALSGVGGSVLCFQPLSQSLGNDQPFYALQSIGMDGKTAVPDSIKEIAEFNIAAIKSIQSTGPYTLLGYSHGGVVAFEMAKKMLKQGDEITSLLLLDSLCPTLQTEDEVEQMVDLYKNLAKAMGIVVADLDTEKLRQITDIERVDYLYDYSKNYGLDMTREQFALMYAMSMSNARACRTYKPAKLSSEIDVFLFRAQDSYRDKPKDYGWNKWLQKPLKGYDIKANHSSIIDIEPIQEVANKILEYHESDRSNRIRTT